MKEKNPTSPVLVWLRNLRQRVKEDEKLGIHTRPTRDEKLPDSWRQVYNPKSVFDAKVETWAQYKERIGWVEEPNNNENPST